MDDTRSEDLVYLSVTIDDETDVLIDMKEKLLNSRLSASNSKKCKKFITNKNRMELKGSNVQQSSMKALRVEKLDAKSHQDHTPSRQRSGSLEIGTPVKSSNDHSYSDVLNCKQTDKSRDTIDNVDDAALHHDYLNTFARSNSLTSCENDKSIVQIKNINELKKVLPKVKLINDQLNNLNDFTEKQSSGKSSESKQKITNVSFKNQMINYCRTCAGVKIPLVDIFSERGIQMRLRQQMQHLMDITEDDNLSTKMCMDCICDLKMSYKFCLQIKKAQVKLMSISASLTTPPTNRNVCNANLKNLQKSVVEKNTETDNSVKKPNKCEKLPLTDVSIVSGGHSDQHDDHTHANNGYESIEEFDPDDSQVEHTLVDSKIKESDTLMVKSNDNDLNNRVNDENFHTNQDTSTVQIAKNDDCTSVDGKIKDETVYEYDTEHNTYIKLESPHESTKPDDNQTAESSPFYVIIPKDAESTTEMEISTSTSKETSKHPSILKRKIAVSKLPINGPTNLTSQNSAESTGVKDAKIRKLNTLNVTPSDENGIMYVTVKGSKPNELLLVKVKKMDKIDDNKIDENIPKKVDDIKSNDKNGGYKNSTYKDIYSVRSKEIENRGAIIEEQIEQYKKKREKILGGIHNSSLLNAINSPIETTMLVNSPRFQKIDDSSVDNSDSHDYQDDTIYGRCRAVDIKNFITNAERERKVDNTNECLKQLTIVRRKWEEIKIRKSSLQRDIDESCAEDSREKLSRILGENDKNIQGFQEYLKQRKIVVARLKDEDIISLYEDHNGNDTDGSTAAQRNLPNLIDGGGLTNIREINVLDCDYCTDIFHSRETLDEHLKIHDYKIFYFCDDCGSEFATNKAKRSHSITCLKKLTCNYCNSMLESKGKKRQHEQKHCDAIYGQLCDMCGEKFKHQGTLDQHIKTQHMSWEKIFQCPKCPKKFAFKQKLTFHVKSVHTTLRAYLCEDCGADFKNPASLRHHRIRKHQPSSNKRECQVCHKLVPFYSLSKHMYTHKAYTIQCPHCDKMFKNTSTLKQHLRIHEDQRQYRCDTCGVGFNRRDGLRLHMRVHQKSDSRALKECSCQICSEKFPNHSMLVIHRNRVHKDGKQYTCHICNRSMLSTRSLEWHMSHIHNEIPPGLVDDQTDIVIEKKRVSCNHCSKTFKTEMILRTHIKNTHMEKNPVKCLDCDLMFTSEVRLRHHMMIAHNRLEGTLTCPHCPKRFVNQLRLKTHMISHSEERPYTCEICGFNLKTKIQLIKHHQNRHSDERPLQCRYCPWRCKQVSALVCHERTHTNERPYSCIVCKQRFKYLGDKNKHERRHESLGGSGFKRIVAGRNIKNIKSDDYNENAEMASASDQEQIEFNDGDYDETNADGNLTMEQQYEMEQIEEYQSKYESDDQEMMKFEPNEEDITDYEHQEYDDGSREEDSENTEVIMSMEDATVYTEEVTADNIEHTGIITEQIISNELLQSGTVVHLQQHNDGKIQVIPVMISLPDLTDDNAGEVNLTAGSIMYNS